PAGRGGRRDPIGRGSDAADDGRRGCGGSRSDGARRLPAARPGPAYRRVCRARRAGGNGAARVGLGDQTGRSIGLSLCALGGGMDFLVHHMLQRSAARSPDREALVHGDERLTYAEVARRTTGLAEGLTRAGVERGDRVGIHLEPSVSQVLSIFGVSQAGAVFVPLNPLLFPEQIVHIANDCRLRGLITSASKLRTLAPVLERLPSLEFLVIVDDAEPPAVALPSHDFAALCQLGASPRSRDEAIEKDLAAILYTSGSTGRPKGVMLTHAQIMAGASIVSTYLGITGADRILAILPFSFDAGMNQLMTAFQQGGTVILMKFVFAREIVSMLARERATGLAGVPTLWTLLAQPSSTLRKTELPHLRYITNTGGAMPQTVLAALRQALPTTQIFLMY